MITEKHSCYNTENICPKQLMPLFGISVHVKSSTLYRKRCIC